MNFDTLSFIVEKFLLKTFANVKTVRVTHIETATIGMAWGFKVDVVAKVKAAGLRSLPGEFHVEVLVAKDGSIVGVNQQPWQGDQRGRKVLQPRGRGSGRGRY